MDFIIQSLSVVLVLSPVRKMHCKNNLIASFDFNLTYILSYTLIFAYNSFIDCLRFEYRTSFDKKFIFISKTVGKCVFIFFYICLLEISFLEYYFYSSLIACRRCCEGLVASNICYSAYKVWFNLNFLSDHVIWIHWKRTVMTLPSLLMNVNFIFVN